jgi:hypothetical protein
MVEVERKPSLYLSLLDRFISGAEIAWGFESKDVRATKGMIESDLFYLGREVLENNWLGEIHSELSEMMMMPDWKKALILVPRDHLKSTFCNSTFVVQEILRNFDTRILIGSETAEKAQAFLRTVKNFLIHPSITEIYGDMVGTKWTDSEIMVSRRRNPSIKEPTVDTCGIGGLKTGYHYDLMIFDDLVNLSNISTPEQIQKVINFYKQALPQLDPNGRMVVIGTRWHKKDLYGYILKNLSQEFQLKVVRKVIEDDRIIYPERFKLDYIESLRREMGGYMFSCQYMNEPRDSDKEDFKEEWFSHYDRLSSQDVYNCYITVDPAISKLKGRHNTGIVVGLVNQRGEVLFDCVLRGQFSPKDTVDRVFELVSKYSEMPNVHYVDVGVEAIGFQEMLVDEFDRRMQQTQVFFPLEELKPKQQSKIDRIRGLQPRYQRGNIWHRRGACDPLEEELLWLGEGSHPDVADAAAYQVKMWCVPNKQEKGEESNELGKYFDSLKNRNGEDGKADWYENPTGSTIH